jgi:hypothetical protein
MILGISGHKRAGKNTTANILHGIVLKEKDLINGWNIGSNGELFVDTKDLGWGEFDVSRKDSAFVEYAESNMWPHVKLYSFADNLKFICTELFKIPHHCVWGTNDDKNQIQEHLLWENMPGVITCPELWDHMHPDGESEYGLTYHAAGPITAREFMQFLGTEIGRRMYEKVWVESTMKKINKEQSELAIIADVRFPDEVDVIENSGGHVLRLTRNVFDDNHPSELALDNRSFKYMIENQDIDIIQLIDKVEGFYKQIQHPFIRNTNVSFLC